MKEISIATLRNFVCNFSYTFYAHRM